MLASKQAEQRRKYQLDFLGSGKNIIVGNKNDLPLSVQQMQRTTPTSEWVEQHFSSGLTADVYKININNSLWTLKKKREKILVQNTDGQTSFLNEVQRRHDFERLKKTSPLQYRGIVDTVYASLHDGVILSPWIEGASIGYFSRQIYDNIFDTLFYIETAGLFECDLSSGNLLLQADGMVRLFDFGYMYPFNPLTDYNSDGVEIPVFHAAERLESRALMQYFMDIEHETDVASVLGEYRILKQSALAFYRKKMDWLTTQKAHEDVLQYTHNFIQLWNNGLQSDDQLADLYKMEAFRSYVLDIHDDIGGQSCSPDTMSKINKVLQIIDSSYDFLATQNGLFWGDEKLTKPLLVRKYEEIKQLAIKYQISNLSHFTQWRNTRLQTIRQVFSKQQ